MAKQTINLGSAPNDRTGDKLRDAFDKINDNFTEVYGDVADLQGSLGSEIANEGFRLYLDGDNNLRLTDGNGVDRFLIQVGEGGVILIDALNGPLRLSTDDSQEWFFGTNGRLSIPNGERIVYRRWNWESPVGEESAGDSYIQAGMGFHIASGEGVALDAVDMTDEENPIYHSFYVGTNGNFFSPGSEITQVSSLEPGAPSQGQALTLSVTNGPNANWVTGTGVVANGINFTIAVADGVPTCTVTDGGTNHWQGETFGPLVGTALGGSTPEDDVYFIVDSVQGDLFTTIDLTKGVHVLDSDGYYVLPDGSDGQIIHLLLTPDRDPNAMWMKVGHGRVGSNTYTDVWFAPFYNANSGVITMIWWDGGWSASGGSWD